MLKMTLSKIKKACSSLAPRVLRGDTSYTLGKFQKPSITVLSRAEKSTKSQDENNAECEKCNQLIDRIFGPSQNPDTIHEIKKTDKNRSKLAGMDLHAPQGLLRNKMPEMNTPLLHGNHGEDDKQNKLLDDIKITTAKQKQCKRLIELIFGPSELPEMINKPKKSKLSRSGLHQTQKQIHKLPEMKATNISHAVQDEKCEKIYSALRDKSVDESNIKSKLINDNCLHATPAKLTEEELAQKVETIDETPLVEAEKSKNEGFNVAPKILGFDNEVSIVRTPVNGGSNRFGEDSKIKHTIESMVRRIEETRKLEYITKINNVRRMKSMLSDERERSDFKSPVNNIASDGRTRKSGSAENENSYDELAKRCLDAPSSQIDRRLLKEMEKLGVPNSGSKEESSMIEENIIQMDVMKKPRKPIDIKEVDLETRDFKRDPPITLFDKLHPAFQMSNCPKKIAKDDIDNTKLKTERVPVCILKPLIFSEQVKTDKMKFEPRPRFDINKIIIDPHDKKNIASDEEERYDPLWYEKYSFTRPQTLQGTAKEAVEDSSVIQSEEKNRSPGAEVLAARAAITQAPLSEGKEIFSDSNKEVDPYIAFECNQLKGANENWQFSEEGNNNTSATKNDSASKTLKYSEPGRETTDKQDKDSTQYFTQSEAKTTESNTLEPKPANAQEVESIETTPEETQRFISPKSSKTLDKQDSELIKHFTQPQTVTTESNPVQPEPTTVVPADFKLKFSTQEAKFIKTTPNKTLQLISPESIKATETYTEQLANASLRYTSQPADATNSAETNYTKLAEEQTFDRTASSRNEDYPTEHSFVQTQTMVNPLVDRDTSTPADEIQKITAAYVPLRKIGTDENQSLSEMLKRVRKRNRMEFCQAYDHHLEEVQGKCGKKTPPCPPPAPKCPPPSVPCRPPMPPPCPRPCKPACPPPCPPPNKSPCQKFTKSFPGNILGLLLRPTSCSQMFGTLPVIAITERSHAVLTNEVSLKLQEIGLNLQIAYLRKTAVNVGSNFDAESLVLARDYEPWVPIPSWPIPKKEIKRPFVCPKEGCKLIPPPKLRPPCNENPCRGFPKRTNSFSITHLLSSVGNHAVFDILD